MLLRITSLVTFISVVQGSVDPDKSLNDKRMGKLWAWQKFFSKGYFNITKTVDSGTEVYEGGDVTIGAGGGDFKNPEYIATRDGDKPFQDIKIVYIATLRPPADAVQIKIDITWLNLLGPDEGDCVNDTFEINGYNPGLEIPTICGKVFDPQILYVDIDNCEGPFSIVISLKCCIPAPAEWFITVGFLMEADAVEHRCLQYFTAPMGMIKSFNYELDPPGMMLNDQTYSICFGYVVGYCSIHFNFERLDMGSLDGICTNDYLLIGDDKICRDYIDYKITANATGPINIGVRQGSINEIEAEGFYATYMMMRC